MIVYHGTTLDEGLKIGKQGSVLSRFDLVIQRAEFEEWKIPEDSTIEEEAWMHIQFHYQGSKRRNGSVWLGSKALAGNYAGDTCGRIGGLLLGFDGEQIPVVREEPNRGSWCIPRTLELTNLVNIGLSPRAMKHEDEVLAVFGKYDVRLYPQ
jgi:hypothetical protein